MATEVCWYIEDWGSTLGTNGENGWIKGTNTKLSTGAGSFLAKDTYLDSNGITNKICMNTSPKILPSKYGSQYHRFDGTNTVFFTKMSMKSDGSLAAWAVFDAWAGAQVQVQVYLTSETSTSYEAVVKTLNLGAGTIITNGTMTLWYDSNGSWNVACSCTSNEGSARSGTLSWAGVGYGTTYPLAASICIQPLGGSSQLFYSRWQYSIPTLPAGSYLEEDWGSTNGTAGTQGASYGWEKINKESQRYLSGNFTVWKAGDSGLVEDATVGASEWYGNEKTMWSGVSSYEYLTGNQYHVFTLGSTNALKGNNMFGIGRDVDWGTYYYVAINQSAGGKTKEMVVYKHSLYGTLSVEQTILPTTYWDNDSCELFIYNVSTGTTTWCLVGTRSSLPFAFVGTYSSNEYLRGTGYVPSIIGNSDTALLYSKWHTKNLPEPGVYQITWSRSSGTWGLYFGELPNTMTWGWLWDTPIVSEYDAGYKNWVHTNKRTLTMTWNNTWGSTTGLDAFLNMVRIGGSSDAIGTLTLCSGSTMICFASTVSKTFSANGGTSASVTFVEI